MEGIINIDFKDMRGMIDRYGGRAGNLDIDTPALPHAPTVDINRLGTVTRATGSQWVITGEGSEKC